MQNLGRNAYQSASDNRENLSPKQQVGFDLVSGFMKHLIDKADKGAQTDDGNSSKRAQQGTGNQFNQQEEEDKRRLSIQSSQRGGDDEDISAGEFFKRLSSAMADPAKFKQEAAQRAKSRQQQSGTTNTNSGQQQRERSNAIGADNRQTATKDLFKSMQGILTDPAGFKRRMESQKNIQQGVKSQPNGPKPNGPQPSEQLPKTDTSTQHTEPKRAQTGNTQEPKKQLARKTNPPVVPKSSPRKSR